MEGERGRERGERRMRVMLAATSLTQWQAAAPRRPQLERSARRSVQDGCLLLLPPPTLVVRGAGLPADFGRFCATADAPIPPKQCADACHPFPNMRHPCCIHKLHGAICSLLNAVLLSLVLHNTLALLPSPE
eukprot:6191782-Pleurochrysis_carterae.AAC.2